MPEVAGYGKPKNNTNVPNSKAKKAPILKSGTEVGTKYGQNPHSKTKGGK